MTDLKRGEQQGGGRSARVGHGSDRDGREKNDGAEFGTSEQATRGTNRDFDQSEEAANQGHGHPREERGQG